MPKKSAIIDIGSNSARLVIFEKSSRYGFRLLCEQKSKVRIGEGAYNRGGVLQQIGIQRGYQALKSFKNTIDAYRVKNVTCVATSALRDAPNAHEFTKLIKDKLNLHINIIGGKEEAFYGGLAVVNLLNRSDSITIDIGGGSSDMTLIRDNKVVDSYSLDIGTVRLKELFFDKNRPIKEAKEYIHQELLKLPKTFQGKLAIGIGGSARTIADTLIQTTNYPLNKLHGFSYKIEKYEKLLCDIINTKIEKLSSFKIKPERYDTIREGTLIFIEILRYIGAKNVITSGVGVREGVFLKRFLRGSNLAFPNSINPSIQSILDRFNSQMGEKFAQKKRQTAKKLLDTFAKHFGITTKYEKELLEAISMSEIGKNLTIYKFHKHSSYIALEELNYGFTHEEMVFIALLLRVGRKGRIKESMHKKYKEILPKQEILEWYGFIYSVILSIFEYHSDDPIEFDFKDNSLIINADRPLYLLKEVFGQINKPKEFTITIND